MRTNDEDHESEVDEKLAVALEASPIIAFAQDLELRLTWLHNQRQDVPPEAYLGKTDYDLNAPEDAERLTALKRRVLETGKPARAEVYLEARAVWFDMSVRPRMRDGRICGVIGTAIDITERRRAEEALRRSEAQLRTVLESSNDCHYRLDLRHDRYEYISPSVEKMFGYSPEEMMAMTPEQQRSMIHPDDRALLAETEAGAKTASREVEYRARTREGEYRWFAGRFSVEHDAEGKSAFRNGVLRDIHDRKLREAAQRESEARARDRAEELETLLRLTPAVIWIAHDPECRRITGSAAAHELLRASEGSNLSKTAAPDALPHFRVLQQGEEVAPEQLAMQRAARGEEVAPCEYELVFDNGDRRYIYGTAVPLRDPSGQPRGAIGAFLDVTDRVQTRQELLVATQRLEAAQQVGGIGIFEWELASGRVYWSEEIYRLMGLEPGAIPATSDAWNEAIAAEDREVGPNAFREAVAARRDRYEVEMRLRQQGGGARWVRVSCLLRYDARGEPSHVLGTVVNIEALRLSAERWRTMAEALPNLVWTDLPDGQCDWLSSQWGKYTGIPENELLGLRWLNTVIHPDDRQRVLACWQAACAGKADYDLEYRIRRYDGEYHWFKTRGVPLRNDRGEIVYWFGTCTDIEDAKRQQMALREASEELEKTNRAKDEFLATLSHELRTPLTSILGWATILREKQKPRDEQKLDRGLEIIERNAKLQERMINDLLDVSRIISGQLRLTLAKTALWEVVHAAAEVVRPAAESKGVRLLVDVDPDLPALIADSARLQQVVWNLLINAIRFTPRGGRVTVSANRPDSNVYLQIRDTGSGIAPEHLPHVFERFRQVDSSTTRSHGGLGLGLALVRHIVEAHGGSVEAKSDGVDRGATFTIMLPVRAVDTSATAATTATIATATTATTTAEAQPPAAEKASLEGMRVLVVDDDADSLDLIRQVLLGAGANVVAVGSAAGALDLAARGPFDVILSDIGMPRMDGYALMKQVRSGEVGADVPSIALTAYVRAEDAERARRAGYQEHLSKPIEPSKLVATLARWRPRKSLTPPT